MIVAGGGATKAGTIVHSRSDPGRGARSGGAQWICVAKRAMPSRSDCEPHGASRTPRSRAGSSKRCGRRPCFGSGQRHGHDSGTQPGGVYPEIARARSPHGPGVPEGSIIVVLVSIAVDGAATLKPQPWFRSSGAEMTIQQTDPSPGFLTVGEVAARSGVAVSALHFYEAKGLIRSVRNRGNQRRYHREILRRVAVIKVAQRAGIPLAEIGAALMSLPDHRTPTAADWARLSTRWRRDLDDRIDRLNQLRDQLDGCIGCGCLSLKACPLRNPHDRLAARGPGPHFSRSGC